MPILELAHQIYPRRGLTFKTAKYMLACYEIAYVLPFRFYWALNVANRSPPAWTKQIFLTWKLKAWWVEGRRTQGRKEPFIPQGKGTKRTKCRGSEWADRDGWPYQSATGGSCFSWPPGWANPICYF